MKKMSKSIWVLAFLVAGATVYARQPQRVAALQQVQQQDGWQLLETKDGISGYWKTAPLGSGEGVYLRFVNASGQPVQVSWTVSFGAGGKETSSNTTTIAAGETATPVPVRISGKASVSFNVSK